ncbi:MAG TPA: nickel-dependent lactate racemase [Thermoanaerobaculia bacterium]|mgnify:CR=1 FL=1|nr:nickel-dependent lactate racemase [Thermoanaerobaculia bacterium]HUM30680.1 nickel-dependent lactate racemase [Thermoanaerobaculia bacterium]HXK68912.1 nickel-dependent lactate racemase [Thermoanaerobaculia bacterium]
MSTLFPCGGTTFTPAPNQYQSLSLFHPTGDIPELTDEQIRAMLRDAIPPAERVVLLVPDGTRAIPLPRFFAALKPSLIGRKVTVLIARGTHREMTRDEVSRHLGPLPEDWDVVQNQCDDEESYGSVGTTSRGTPVAFHRSILEADFVMGITLVRPHYYAGFSGGRKIFLPGCTSRKTIQANHRFVLHDDPAMGKNQAARLANLEGNPVHEDMVEAMGLFPHSFACIHTVMSGKRIVAMTLGKNEAFLDAVSFVRTHLELNVSHSFDTIIVSAGGHPKDLNFIQSHKALENVFQAVKPGGQIFLYADCPDGLGSEEMDQFLNLGDIRTITEALHRDFKIYGHTALSFLMKTRHCAIHLCSSLPSGLLSRMNIHRWDGRTLPEDCGTLALVPDASSLYLVHKETV